MRMDFEECPICHKKGWYVERSEYNLANFQLRACRYCHAVEKVNFDDKHPSMKLYERYVQPYERTRQ